MFRVWGKLMKDNRLLRDTVVNVEEDISRTKKVYRSLELICYEFDLQQPIWLKKNIKEFLLHSKTRFTRDSFIESVSFDYLEFHLIEEDEF